MKIKLFAAAALAVALSAGFTGTADAADGEKVFKKCKACHAFDKNKSGPNLSGVVGRACGAVDGFKYGKGYKAACEVGFTLDEAFLDEYLTDPSKALTRVAGQKARSKMSFKLRKPADRAAVIEYLKTK